MKNNKSLLQQLPVANNCINQINNYIPGSSKASINKPVIKLSSNENALGCSKKAEEAFLNHKDKLFRYAEASCQDLRVAIANRLSIEAENIVCGAGSDELIFLLTLAFANNDSEVIISEYGFLMYEISAQKIGAKVVKAKEEGLRASAKNIFSAITDKTKIIFLANPNNPTGTYLNQQELLDLVSKIPSNILVVLDCAYEEFATNADYPDHLNFVKNFANVVVLRTFSKIYGLASLRIGWCYSSKEIANILHKVRGPFNVSGAAQVAAIAAINDNDFLLESKNHNQVQLNFIQKSLESCKSFSAVNSSGNFLLFNFFSEKNADTANNHLLSQGIIVRSMQSYNLSNYLRITIGTAEQNIRLVEELNGINSLLMKI